MQTMFRTALVFILFLVSADLFAQTTLTGKVTSAENREGVAGVSVTEKGTRNTTSTDATGNYSITVKNSNATLVFTYVGMANTEIKVAGRTTVDVELVVDNSSLSDVVVTASRQPIRKLQTTTAVEVIGKKELTITRPEGLGEAVIKAPGLFVSNAQGRFRATVYTRGFPDGSGNGMIYTSFLLDGLPTLATPARPADFSFGVDPGVERIEVVRGSAATLFGRAAAAGVINAITKTGGLKNEGTVRLTRYNSNFDRPNAGMDYKLEFGVSGPISKTVRYNVAGYYVHDRGFRNLGFPDKGGQVRGNIDILFPKNKGSVRFYAGLTDITIQNMIDIPYQLTDFKPRAGWKITDSYYNPALDTIAYRIRHQKERGNPAAGYDTLTRLVRDANKDGNYARGYTVGLQMDYHFGHGFTLVERLRTQRFFEGTKFNLGASTTYTEATASQFRLIIDGDGRTRDFMNETRIEKSIDLNNGGNLNLAAGIYASRQKYEPETYSFSYAASPDRIRIGAAFSGAPFAQYNNRFGGRSRIETYTEEVFAYYFGGDLKLMDNRLNMNFGIRQDKLDLDMAGFNRIDSTITRKESHQDWTYSIGGNYLITPTSSVYANFIHAFRMPDYSAYTVLGWNTGTKTYTNAPLGIPKNEIINNVEIGYRNGIGQLGFDLAAFYTKIDNRLAVFYENGVGVSKPQGSNRIMGAELSVFYTPKFVKGLNLRTNFTVQNSEFVDFTLPVGVTRNTSGVVTAINVNPSGNLYGNTLKQVQAPSVTNPFGLYEIDLKGKKVPVVPGFLWNFIAGYDHEYFGVNFSINYVGRRYEDATNLIKIPDITTINAGVYAKYPMKNGNNIRLDFNVKNLLNTTTVFRVLYFGDSDAALRLKQNNPTFSNVFATGIPQLPRRSLLTLSYNF
jgi:outer membrane receptor protein involved in Fe transport